MFRPDDTLQAMDVGSLLPLHATALGKALLAHDANAAASIRDTALESYCRRTITDPRDLARAATRVRENGWAAEIEELSIGDAGIAAPIRGYGDSSSAPSASPARSSGSATPAASPSRGSSPSCGTRPAPCPATSAARAGDTRAGGGRA